MSGFYVVGAWLIIQIGDVFFPAWGLPETALRFLIIATILCFADPDEVFDNSLKRSDYIVLVALLTIGAAIVFGSLQKIVEEVDDAVVAVATVAKIENSVAVIPFDNLDTNPDTGYFSDGVTEEILHKLSSSKALHILSRASSFAFRDSNEGPARISEILGVRYLLHGSVRRDNNLVRVTASLIDDTGFQVWSETFDRKLEGIFAIQSEIANAVAIRIEREIIPLAENSVGRITTNMDAYDAYLVGRAFVNSRTPLWQDKAIAAFDEAIRLDENFAPPYAGLAVALSMSNDWEANRESAVRAAKTAIELDPELADGHAALGLLLLDDALLLGDKESKLPRAERSLRRALELDPSLSMAYNWLSICLQQQGRIEEAKAVQEQGLLIDPLNPVLSANIAARLTRLGERERAERVLLRLTYLPDPPGGVYAALWMHYFFTGEFDKTLYWAKENTRAWVAARGGHPYHAGYLAWDYERLGLSEDADYWMADAMVHSPQPEEKFFYKAWQFGIRGDLAGMRAEIDKLRAALGTDIDGLQSFYAVVYAAVNIFVGNFDVGIDVFENAFDVESTSKILTLEPFGELESLHLLAYAYQQVGRDDEANVLLTRLHEQLNAFVVERKLDFGPLHHLRAQNFGLRGDFDAAADALEAAIKAGWLRYIWVMNDPTWAETIADPRIARMLDDVKVELDSRRICSAAQRPSRLDISGVKVTVTLTPAQTLSIKP